MFKAIPFKQKPIHDKYIKNFISEIKSVPHMKELSPNENIESQGISLDENGPSSDKKHIGNVSVASKLRIIMDAVRSNDDMMTANAEEFKKLT